MEPSDYILMSEAVTQAGELLGTLRELSDRGYRMGGMISTLSVKLSALKTASNYLGLSTALREAAGRDD